MKHILVASLVLIVATPLAAQTGPSEAQQRFACMGDALRLCPQHIPNREAIIQCLSAQRAALSEGCRPVFDASLKALLARRRHGA